MARLLIVHDHRTFAEVLAQALSEMGHEVVGDCWMAHQGSRPPRRTTTSS